MKTKFEKSNKKDRIKEILSDEKRITDALQRAVHDAVEAHRRAGNPIAALKDGKVILIETK